MIFRIMRKPCPSVVVVVPDEGVAWLARAFLENYQSTTGKTYL